ncbi:hypothetical protein IZY60_06230 [Lutibacter sp. B2]|nr:hypothetical protein [Lutibacter sp. B2]
MKISIFENIGKSRFFSKNTTAKIVSIIFALTMWLYVMGEVNPQSIIEFKDIPVKLLNTENLKQTGLIVMGQEDFTIDVKLQGRRNDLYKVRAEDIAATADIRGYQKGVSSIPVEISSPVDTDIKEISPKQIKITLDEVVMREKPIITKIVGKFPTGFEAGYSEVSISQTIVEGPESLVNNVHMLAAYVNVDKITSSIEQKLPLKAVDIKGKEVKGISIKTKYVNVKLPVYKVKDVPISPVYNGNLKEGLKITGTVFNKDTLKIRGTKDVIDKISVLNTKSINLNDIEKTTQKAIELIIPQGVELVKLEQKFTIDILIENIKTKVFTYSKNELTVENLKEGEIIDKSIFPDTINVEVKVVESIFEDILKEDVKIFIDLRDRKEGVYFKDILYSTNKKIEEVTITPKNVGIKINEKTGDAPINNEYKE